MNNIYNEDCIGERGLRLVPDKSVDMILSDLPYGTTACKWDSVIPLDILWSHYERIIKDNGAIVLTASQPFTSVLVMSNISLFRYEWIWDKGNPTNFASANKQPLKYHESVLVFSKKQTVYNPQKWRGKINHSQGRKSGSKSGESREVMRGEVKRGEDDTSGLKFPRSIIEFPKHSSQCGLHPTQKPVELFRYLILTYTNEGDIVLDSCAGSGTTAVACLNTNRNFICYELDKKYFEVARDRIDCASKNIER
jgi:site-specific DNA-methyltransferase (adenine-specific)